MSAFIDRPDWHARYDHSYLELMKLAFQGGTDARACDVDRLQFLRSYCEFDPRPLYRFSPKLVAESLQSVHGRLSPLLKIPPILKRPITRTATETLREMFHGSDHQDLVCSILDQSISADRDFRYRTQPVRVIIGHNGADVRSLAGFAHELGHCIFEVLYPRAPRLEFYSELFAICLEWRIVETYLTDESERQAWIEYQGRVDELNFALAELERWDGCGIEHVGRPELPDFDRSLLLLRETLFTRPGYQSFYAEGSARRMRIMRKVGSRADS